VRALGELEAQVMHKIWARPGPVTVRDIVGDLQHDRPIAYTTVMTLMRILQEKGYLTRATHEKAHVYRPAKPRQQVIGGMVRDFLDRVFDGAPDSLLLHLAKDNKLTEKQRRIVKQLVEEIDE
jgi:BlaI family penicillinase repressor